MRAALRQGVASDSFRRGGVDFAVQRCSRRRRYGAGHVPETRQKKSGRDEGNSSAAQMRELVGWGARKKPALDAVSNPGSWARAIGSESTYSASEAAVSL